MPNTLRKCLKAVADLAKATRHGQSFHAYRRQRFLVQKQKLYDQYWAEGWPYWRKVDTGRVSLRDLFYGDYCFEMTQAIRDTEYGQKFPCEPFDMDARLAQYLARMRPFYDACLDESPSLDWECLETAAEQWEAETLSQVILVAEEEEEEEELMLADMDFLEDAARLWDELKQAMALEDDCTSQLLVTDDDEEYEDAEEDDDDECEDEDDYVLFVASMDCIESINIREMTDDNLEPTIDYLERIAQSWAAITTTLPAAHQASSATPLLQKRKFLPIIQSDSPNPKTTLSSLVWSDPNWKASMDFLEACAEEWPQEASGLDWFQFCAMGHAGIQAPHAGDEVDIQEDDIWAGLLNWKAAFFNLVIRPSRRQHSFSCSADELMGSMSLANLGSQEILA